ncbi:hypothetical protein I7I53_10388 [Histoplasma capsulatum var. duboisii H88]|uniref:Uncharacterized protein n=1 Tax=Ajellomyces capsulatus (strain H88) TaxID=544711 RepID=A0A8A1L669_AJEC8|nr:hypothetical protein I7I53_10388 [Histoplasma capsulatum var. duboisii H88]
MPSGRPLGRGRCPRSSGTLNLCIYIHSTLGTVYGACLLLHACRINQCRRNPGIPLYLFPHG